MLTSEVEEAIKNLGVNMAIEPNIVVAINEVRMLLEALFIMNNKELQPTTVQTTKTSPELQSYLKALIDENKSKYSEMSKEEYFNFLYGEISKADPTRAMAMREHISEVSETIKNTVMNGGASIKGTLSEGVDTIITDTEKEIAESLKQDVNVADGDLTNIIVENIGETEEKEEVVEA